MPNDTVEKIAAGELVARLRAWRRSEFGQSPPGYMFEEAADMIESLSRPPRVDDAMVENQGE